MRRGGKEEKNNNKPLVTVHEEGSEERIKVGNTVSECFFQSGPQGVANFCLEKKKLCHQPWLVRVIYGCRVIVVVINVIVGQESLVQGLHEWIEQLCDPEENFCETLRAQLDPGWEEEDQEVRVSGFVVSYHLFGLSFDCYPNTHSSSKRCSTTMPNEHLN